MPATPPQTTAALSLCVKVMIPTVGEVHLNVDHARQLYADLSSVMRDIESMNGPEEPRIVP